MKNIPQKIYLQVDADGELPEDFKELEVTWASNKIHDTDLEYTLAAQPHGYTLKQVEDALKIVEYIERNNSKINNHTWKAYKEQIESHIEDLKHVLSSISPAQETADTPALSSNKHDVFKVIKDLIKWIPDTYIARFAISNAIDYLNTIPTTQGTADTSDTPASDGWVSMDTPPEAERLQSVIYFKQGECKQWADMCIKKQQRIEDLESEDVKKLLNFFLWFRENGELHIDKSIEKMIDIYLHPTKKIR